MQVNKQSVGQTSIWRSKLLWSLMAFYTVILSAYLWYETAGLLETPSL